MKDTFFFSHDYNTRADEKIKRLVRAHGMTGYGVFWAIIEDLYTNANALQTDCDGIAYDLRVDVEMVKSILNDFDLFIFEEGKFGSLSVQRRLSERDKKSVKARESARKRWSVSEENANAMRTHCEGNAIKDRKGKDIKEEILISSKEEIVGNEFPASPSQKLNPINQENENKAILSPQNDSNQTTPLQDDKKATASRKKAETVNYDAVVDLYHTHCKSDCFPKVLTLNKERQRGIELRLKEMGNSFETLEKIFIAMEKSSFLKGGNERGWSATFDWVFGNSKNWVKVLEGNYNDKKNISTKSSNNSINDLWKK